MIAVLGLRSSDLFVNRRPAPPRSHRPSEGDRWQAIWGRLADEAAERTEQYLRGEEPPMPRPRAPAEEHVRPEGADYIGPGGEPRKLLPPLERDDFDTDHE